MPRLLWRHGCTQELSVPQSGHIPWLNRCKRTYIKTWEKTMQARAAVMPERHGRWTIETLEVAEPGPQKVLVRVVASGICQTDVHARDGFFPMPFPAVFGHEGAGVVEQVGRAVTTLNPGDHVLMANPSCGACP